MTKKYPSGEYNLLSKLQNILGPNINPAYELGIGDDAAVRKCLNESLIITTDISVEDVHFSRNYMNFEEIGYRAMVTNLSDCASMGSLPDSAFIQLVFPSKDKDIQKSICDIYKGFARACKQWNFSIVGGDLSGGNCWVLGITLMGKSTPNERVLKRKGIKDGDLLVVSGFPGQSAAGFEVLKRWGRNFPPHYNELVKKHVEPIPRIELGRELIKHDQIHAVMDLSDGISKDARTLCYENDIGLIIKTESLPIPNSMLQLSKEISIPWEELFLHGGEDYELLIALDPDFDLHHFCKETLIDLTVIGTFDKKLEETYVQTNQDLQVLAMKSWDHSSFINT